MLIYKITLIIAECTCNKAWTLRYWNSWIVMGKLLSSNNCIMKMKVCNMQYQRHAQLCLCTWIVKSTNYTFACNRIVKRGSISIDFRLWMYVASNIRHFNILCYNYATQLTSLCSDRSCLLPLPWEEEVIFCFVQWGWRCAWYACGVEDTWNSEVSDKDM